MITELVSATPDLPDPDTRWVPSRKEAVIESIARGEVTEQQVLQRYPDLSIEELQSWQQHYHRRGRKGLRVTRRQP